ncbi:hypothetical protein CFP56_038430 [Quercus suber]|uniref:Uncharacterized protein n=1 Tax=Quercus suber TaxID=58331 RepID=A0AAW0J2S9_QUESU
MEKQVKSSSYHRPRLKETASEAETGASSSSADSEEEKLNDLLRLRHRPFADSTIGEELMSHVEDFDNTLRF